MLYLCHQKVCFLVYTLMCYPVMLHFENLNLKKKKSDFSGEYVEVWFGVKCTICEFSFFLLWSNNIRTCYCSYELKNQNEK